MVDLQARDPQTGDAVILDPFGGAGTTLIAAERNGRRETGYHGIGGRYLEDCQEAQTIASRADSDGRHGVAAYALDPDNAQRLWETSERRLASLRA